MSLLDDDVEVGVMPGLVAEAGVHPPAPVQPDTNAVGVHQAEKAANIVCGHLRGTHRAGHSSAATTSRAARGRGESRAPPRRHLCPRAARMAADTRLRVGRAFAVETHDAATSPDGRG